MSSWLSIADRAQMPDIKRISFLQALLVTVIAWYIRRIIKNCIAYQVRLLMPFATISIHASFFLAA